ncbi:MAG: transcription elongation factor GreA [Erysipelotrichaceae bacterium]|nr:transcription elongation factor GreA [Erysipelotrichaceae bacterium]
MEEKFYVTEEGLNDLKKELETLIHVTREEVIEELKAARAQGDLSENADYDAARDHQAKVESRIKELEHQIKNAEIIAESRKTNFVRIGSTVEIQELDTKHKITYKIVGSVEADPLNGLLSNVTPLAEAILDHKVNDVVTVKVDMPYDVKILKIN